MPILAVLFAPDDAARVPVIQLVGGLTVFDRQRLLAGLAGVNRVIIVGSEGASAALGGLEADGAVLVLDPAVVADPASVAAVVASAAPAIGIWPAGVRAGVERIDARDVAAGIAVYPAAMVRAVAAGLGEWDFASTLLRTALAAGATRIDLSATMPPPVWTRVTDTASARAATDALIAATAVIRPGWPARWLYPAIETGLVQLVLPLPIGAVAIRSAWLCLAVLVALAFVIGWWTSALVLALVCCAVEGVAGQLARIRLAGGEGRRDTVIRRLIGPIWCAAGVAGFVAAGGGVAAMALGALLAGFALAERRQRDFFRRLTGATIDAAGSFEQKASLFAARRDVLLWTALPFAAIGSWQAGLAAAAAHATISFFVVQWRCFVRLDGLGQHRLP